MGISTGTLGLQEVIVIFVLGLVLYPRIRAFCSRPKPNKN
jgi:hypothetical protein